VNAGRRRAAAVADVVHVAGAERDRLAHDQLATGQPTAAGHPVLLEQDAAGRRERP
jgi:hypothetical protein